MLTSAKCVVPQISIVALTKAGLKVVGQGYDSNFGGRNFDEVCRRQEKLSGSSGATRR